MTTIRCNQCKHDNFALSVICAFCGKNLPDSSAEVTERNKKPLPLLPFNSNVHIRSVAKREKAKLLELPAIKCSTTELSVLFDYAKQGYLISGNPYYSSKMNATSLEVDNATWQGRFLINAFACEFDIVLAPGASEPAIPSSEVPAGLQQVTGPCIVINDFLLMSASVAAVFLCSAMPASNVSKERLYDLSKALEFDFTAHDRHSIERFNHCVHRAELLCTDRALVKSAIRVQNGMITHVIAHEMGHLCLGHTCSLVRVEDEVSRNMEREADSFAASILHTLDNRAYHFVGQILFDLMMTWQHHGIAPQTPTSHPCSRDRFHAAFVSNPTAASEAEALFGMSQDDWIALLP
jgi:hypothetical protein